MGFGRLCVMITYLMEGLKMNLTTIIGFLVMLIGWGITIGVLKSAISNNTARSKQNQLDLKGIDVMKSEIVTLQGNVKDLNKNHDNICSTLREIEAMLNQLIGKLDTYFKIFNKDGQSGLHL